MAAETPPITCKYTERESRRRSISVTGYCALAPGPPTHSTMTPTLQSFEWKSPQGLIKLRNLVLPSLPYEPRDFQLYDSACILDGQDVICISATGDGKSALIYIPAMARKQMVTVVIEPTNFLENDMASSLISKGLTAVVINADTLAFASLHGCDLWEEARGCRFQVMTISPEYLRSPEFNGLVQDRVFRARWHVLIVDEAHLADEWGADFRPLYKDIWTLRSRGPDHLTVVALSATIEPGAQTDRVLRHLGFRKGAYHLDRRNCERRNVDFVFRDVMYSSTTHQFRDLDWLIPQDMVKASDLPKRVVYCDTIELGHRVTSYLRTLLPPHLQRHARTTIRHLHSIACSDCKREGIEALYKTGDGRETALFISTAIMEVGIDVPDIQDVILFPIPRSASSLLQRGGRPVRGLPGTQGKVFVYVKQSDREATMDYVASEPCDNRLLKEKGSLKQVKPQPEPFLDEYGVDIKTFTLLSKLADKACSALRARIEDTIAELRARGTTTSPSKPSTPGIKRHPSTQKSPTKSALRDTQSATPSQGTKRKVAFSDPSISGNSDDEDDEVYVPESPSKRQKLSSPYKTPKTLTAQEIYKYPMPPPPPELVVSSSKPALEDVEMGGPESGPEFLQHVAGPSTSRSISQSNADGPTYMYRTRASNRTEEIDFPSFDDEEQWEKRAPRLEEESAIAQKKMQDMVQKWGHPFEWMRSLTGLWFSEHQMQISIMRTTTATTLASLKSTLNLRFCSHARGRKIFSYPRLSSQGNSS
ncbi:hypothetical protein EW146_g5036 [Bondarzewia mesenterica]|uniref:DNA 3'-5' helicase n=1 Tax=Bondarzewia mesenterica TaxID=1095465 RepID=A0A4S4LSM9_9AGAM|nr:hypothetical protein EW146_g5036 [Bondarzewia mesenterica]